MLRRTMLYCTAGLNLLGAAALGGQAGSAAASARRQAAPGDTAPKLTFGGFVDTYYAWDFERPYNFDRAYTTQPARHAEFNINVAFLEAKVAGPRYRGRLALQFGTSVQANYAGEPRIGRISGPSVTQFLQEATVGYQLGPSLWVDGGIFFAHTGYEGWISRDNLSYSRSLMADFSPYYEAGVKLTWTPSPAVTAQLDVVNGWQDISHYNTPPAVGLRVDCVLSPRVTVSYDNFVGNVAPDSLAAQWRFFNDFIAVYNPPGRWQFAATADLGAQGRSTTGGGTATWYAAAVFAKYHVTPRVGVVARLERYADPSEVLVQTGLPFSFRTSGASLGVDVAPVPRVLWRSEVRAFRSDDPVWPTHRPGAYARGDGFAVTSLALTL
ncbi:MAG TPA: porin [Gemmatimonadales bacterium]|nr:porin [Gemmatimonadales bacterium]